MLKIQEFMRVHWRLWVMVTMLMVTVLVPFALWGDSVDRLVQAQLSDASHLGLIAATGFVLLALDVLLPIPSSVLSMMLCLVLGPYFGAMVVLAGMVGAFLLGYLLGMVLPDRRLRRWMGEAAWTSFAGGINSQSLFWLAATRPIPVLAEVSSVMAGVARVPLIRALTHVIVSSALVSAAYAYAAIAGLAAARSSLSLLVLISAVLPCASWSAYRLMVRLRNPYDNQRSSPSAKP